MRLETTTAFAALGGGVRAQATACPPTTGPEISLAPERLFNIGPLPVTNTMLTAWIVVVVVAVLARLAFANPKLTPKGWQNFVEWVTLGMLAICENVGGRERGRRFFPLVCSFFLFIIVANWMELVPVLVGNLHVAAAGNPCRNVPILREPTSDLNMTLGLTLVTWLYIQWTGLRAHKLGYVSRFVNLTHGPMGAFVGVLELISELAKLISFSFRLLGNIFAGSVVLLVISFLIPILVPVPFFGLELFVGFIQAFVFAMLTLVFLVIADQETAH